MRKLLAMPLALTLLISCAPKERDSFDPVPDNYSPILMKRTELEKSIRFVEARPISNAGKIYIKDEFLFVSEKFDGIHVIDNSNPSDPEPLGFITIPGNIDIAISDGVFYADNAVDLVAFRWTGDSIQVTDRNRDVFPELTPPDWGAVPYEYLPENRVENTVITKWVLK